MWQVAACLVFTLSGAPPSDAKSSQVDTVLDGWHAAAAAADEERYFGYFARDAVFLGTDATERWNKEEFRTFAHPYFKKGEAWKFKATHRNVSYSADGKTAWFDEALSTPNLGPARGSGVLVLEGPDWKIAQYNLSVPIPNGIFKDVKKMIEAAAKPKDKDKP